MTSSSTNLNWKNLSRFSSARGYDHTAAAGLDVNDADIQNILSTNGITTSGAGPVTLSAGAHVASISTTDNVAGAVAINANGGTAETICISSTQGTTASAVNIVASAGGVTLAPAAGQFVTCSQPVAIHAAPSGVAGAVAIGYSVNRTAGGATGTLALQKSNAGTSYINNYMPIWINGTQYWIPLSAVDPQTN